MVRRSRALAPLLQAPAGVGSAVWPAGGVHGDVARFRGGHRGGRNAHSCRHGPVRQAEEAVTVGFEAPLPPARTGVADYAAVLLAALRCRGTVEVAPKRADVRLYHLGNNQVHRPIYQRALTRPGIVVLHDAVLQHFFLGSLHEREYVEEFVYNYGEWSREL